MRKLNLFFLAMVSALAANASAVSPYAADFNTTVDVSNEEFRAAPGWGHLVSKGTYASQKVTYTYLADGGIDGSGAIQAGNQYYQDWIWADGEEVELNDLLVTPAVSGTVSLQVKKATTAGNIRFYKVTKQDGAYVRGELIPFEDPGLVGFDFTEVQLTGIEDGTLIGIRAENVIIDDFAATSADVVLAKGLTIASVTPAVDALTIDCDENNQFTVAATVVLKNSGEVTLTPGDEDYTLSIALMMPGQGSDYVVERLLVTNPVDVTLEPGQQSQPIAISATIDEASIEPQQGSDTKGRRYDVVEGIGGTNKGIKNYTPVPYQPIATLYNHDAQAIDNGGKQQFGLATAPVTRNITIANDGAAPMSITSIEVQGEGFTTTATAPATVAKHESLDIEVTLASEQPGAKTGTLTIKGEGFDDQVVNLVGEVLDPSKWYVDFEDGQLPANMINMGGWATSNKLVVGDNKYYANNDSEQPMKLVSPSLVVAEGETLSFDAARNYGSTSTVEVYYSPDREQWTLLRTLSIDADNDADRLTSDYSGSAWGSNTKYLFTRFTIDNVPAGEGYIAFAAGNARIDNILGFSVAEVAHDAYITAVNMPAVGMVNNTMTATVTLKNLTANVEEAGSYKGYVYFYEGEQFECMAEVEGEELAASGELTYTFDIMPSHAGTFEARVSFISNDYYLPGDNGFRVVSTLPVTITEETATRDVVVGTSNDGENRSAAPLNLYNNNSESENIYTAAQLGIPAGSKITRIAFKGHGSSEKSFNGTLKMWLENTADATPQNVLLDAEKMAAMTSVYDGAYAYKVLKTDADVVVVELAEPFEYTGQNLRVCLHAENSGWATTYFQHDTSVTGQSVYRASDYSLSGNFVASALPVMYMSVTSEALTYSGVVTDQNQQPVEGAVVTLTARDEQPAEPEQPEGLRRALGAKVTYTGTTDVEGRFEIPVIQSGRTYDVVVNAEGYKPATAELTFVDGQPQVANFVLELDDVTAIADVRAADIDRNAPIFDMMGRRVVGALTPGIYVQDGRKFIVK